MEIAAFLWPHAQGSYLQIAVFCLHTILSGRPSFTSNYGIDKTSPNRGRPRHRSGTREIAITPLPYVVVYAVKAEPVEICISITVRKTGADVALQSHKSESQIPIFSYSSSEVSSLRRS